MKPNRFFIGIVVIMILGAIGLAIILKLTSPSKAPDTTEAFPTQIEGNSITSDEESALQALTDFLSALHSGDYATADALYGGSYDILIGYNADLDPADHAALLERACTTNGFNCLLLKTAGLDQTISESEFLFTVELQTDDGALFEIGPCCGEDEEGFVPVSTFSFKVIKIGPAHFHVMDLPPYTP